MILTSAAQIGRILRQIHGPQPFHDAVAAPAGDVAPLQLGAAAAAIGAVICGGRARGGLHPAGVRDPSAPDHRVRAEVGLAEHLDTWN